LGFGWQGGLREAAGLLSTFFSPTTGLAPVLLGQAHGGAPSFAFSQRLSSLSYTSEVLVSMPEPGGPCKMGSLR